VVDPDLDGRIPVPTIDLYPPELGVWAEREIGYHGVPQSREKHFIRHGGMGTTADDYVAIGTRWRVRVTPNGSGTAIQYNDNPFRPDGGPSEDASPGPIFDLDELGNLYEIPCTELPNSASALEREYCFADDRIVDVPAGVAPLAGWVVGVGAGSHAEVGTFRINPGKQLGYLNPALSLATVSGTSIHGLTVGNYYVHAIGRQVIPRDRNSDGILSDSELESSPPDFATDSSPVVGRPTNAITLKNLYRGRPEGQSHRDGEELPLFYDQEKELELRIVDVTSTTVTASDGRDLLRDSNPEEPTDFDDPDAAAELEDSYYAFLYEITEPDSGRADPPPGDYQVRFGGDAFGINCDLTINAATGTTDKSLSGSCDGEYIPYILSAHDIVYIELYLSGNAENIWVRIPHDDSRTQRKRLVT